jgi:Domain of unknown function (DUF2760)
MPGNSPAPLPLATRLWFAWVCLVRVLFDPSFAGRVWAVRSSPAMLPNFKADGEAGDATASPPQPLPEDAARREDEARQPTNRGLQLLALLQRDGRFVDFIEQDVTGFTDEEVGAAARVVHEGCRKVLHRVTSVSSVRPENEGSQVVIEAGFSPAEIMLVGNVKGAAPYRGTLRHKGWRVAELHLPEAVNGHDPHILAPAEVEL